MKASPKKPRNIGATTRKLISSLKPQSALLATGIIFAILSSVLAVFGPKILGDMTTIATTSLKNTGTIDWQPLFAKLILLIIIFLATAIVSYFQSFVVSLATAKYTKAIRARILEKISHLPLSYFDKRQFGDTLSIMSNDVDVLANSLSNEITEAISSLATVIGITVMMFSISAELSFIALVTVPISLVFVSKVVKKAQKLFHLQRATLGRLNNHIEEDYSGQVIIKSNSHESASYEAFARVNQDLYEQSWKSQFLSSLAFPLTHFFTNIGYIIICILGGTYVIGGKLLIGSLQSFLQYVGQFNRPLTNVSEISATVQLTLAAAERIFNFLEQPEEIPDPQSPATITNIRGAVEFHDVNFSYDNSKQIIKNFSIKIEPGQQVAIVGPTGAGKTTIINLLMRFYDPTSGYISIDGVSTLDMKRSDVRKLFGMVLQDTWLFSGSIKDNLKYGKLSATDQEIRSAAKNANIHHYIESLDHCYDSTISEDSDNISAGEKQLLTIARAIVANPPMLILDEATSNVDTRTEQLIQEAFDKITKNRTSFIIAHRLSTIRNADLILVMQNGEIAEYGNHESLISKNGVYTELYNSQFAEK